MAIAFAIPAHNEEAHIARTVEACMAGGRASGEEFAVFVACDACTDRSVEIARAAGARVIEVNKRIIAGVRNAGGREAVAWLREHSEVKGGQAPEPGLIIFVDADTAPPVASVLEAREAIREGAVGGGAPFNFDGGLPWMLRFLQALMNAAMRTLSLTGGCFLFCRPEAFERVGGFDETLLVSEEITMAQELKKHGRFVIVRTPVVTSGRKLRTYSVWEITALLVRGILRPSMRRDRAQLDLWYGPRREDLHHGAHPAQRVNSEH